MSTNSISDAVFLLGRISHDSSRPNSSLLERLSDVMIDALGVDAVALTVFQSGVESGVSARCIRLAPVRAAVPDTGFEWPGDETARRLARLKRGRLYHRPDLIGVEPHNGHGGHGGHVGHGVNGSRLGGSGVSGGTGYAGDHAVALYRRSDGAELLLGVFSLSGHEPLARTTLARAGALAPFVARCWAHGWAHEAEWVGSLRPVTRQILEQVLEGYDDDQISRRTGLTYHSVRAHLKRLFRQAGVRSRLHLMQSCRSGGALENGHECVVETVEDGIGVSVAVGAGVELAG